MALIKNITLGCDPEFGLVNPEGTIVNAMGCVKEQIGVSFGLDHGGRIMELRPAPSPTPMGLVDNIRALMVKGLSLNPETSKHRWKAGSMVDTDAIGGHVHLGHKSFIDSPLGNRVIELLNRVVTPLFILLEHPVEAVHRRVGTGYGAVSGSNSMRNQPHGVEYRALPSWLGKPEHALGAISLSHLVACNSDTTDMVKSIMSLPQIDLEALENCDKKYISAYIYEIAKVVRNLESFGDHRSAIVKVFQNIQAGVTLDLGDMKEEWKLEPIKGEAKKKLKAEAVAVGSGDAEYDDEDE